MEEVRRWEEMEMDCLANIFQRLSLEDMAVAVPFVCRSWLQASLDPLCWRALNFRQLNFLPWSSFTRKFTAAYSYSDVSADAASFSGLLKLLVARSKGVVTEIQFPLVFGASLQDLLYASNRCPRLKSVVLPSLSEVDEGLAELVGKWRDLERLEMESKPSSFSEMVRQISLNCKNFSGLRMAGSVEAEDVSAIVTYLPMIKHLSLSKSYLAKEQLLGILNGCRELESVSVRDCIGFEADDEEILRKASGIKAFECEGSKLLDDYSGYETDECDPFYIHVMG